MVNPTNGKDYSALQKNNPYRNYQYTPSFWDRVLGGINDVTGTHLFRTPQERYAMDMENQARAYDAQIGEIQREEAYNSPDEQAQRMREAGINPDLENSGISGGEASAFDNQSVSNVPSADFGEAQNAMNIAGQIFARVSQIPTSVMSLLQSGLKLRQDSMSLFGDINEAATDFLIEHQGSDPSWWTNKSREEVLHYVMNLPQIKSSMPLVSQRRAFANSVYDRSRTLSTTIGQVSKRGELLRTVTDPMNVDKTLITSVNEWQATYNKFRLEALARSTKAELDEGLPESGAKIKSLENELKNMELEGMTALVEHFKALFKFTGQQGYAYAVSMAQSILNGQIQQAIGTFLAGKTENGITALSNSSNDDSTDNPTDAPSQPRRARTPSQIPSGNTPTVETSPTGSLLPEDDPTNKEYWRKKWRTFKKNAGSFLRDMGAVAKSYYYYGP